MSMRGLLFARRYGNDATELFNSISGIHFPLFNNLDRVPNVGIPKFRKDSLVINGTPTFDNGLHIDDSIDVSMTTDYFEDAFGLGLTIRLNHEYETEMDRLHFFTLTGANNSCLRFRKMPGDDWGDRLEFEVDYGGSNIIRKRPTYEPYELGDILRLYLVKRKNSFEMYYGNEKSLFLIPAIDMQENILFNKLYLGSDDSYSNKGDGYYYNLQIDRNPDPQKYFNRTIRNKPIVCMTWDDGYESDYSIIHPVLKRQRVKGTTFINASRVGNSGRMTWEQIKELYDSGLWDIQDHGYTHTQRTELTVEQMNQETEDTRTAFLANDLPIPEHFCLSYGAINQEVEDTLSQDYFTLRGTGRTLSTYWLNDMYILPHGFDDHVISDVEGAKHLADVVAATGTILVPYAHEADASKGDFFEEFIIYAKSKGITFMTISELFKQSKVKQ